MESSLRDSNWGRWNPLASSNLLREPIKFQVGYDCCFFQVQRRFFFIVFFFIIKEGLHHHLPGLGPGNGPCTLRNILEILLNQPEIRLYLPFSD